MAAAGATGVAALAGCTSALGAGGGETTVEEMTVSGGDRETIRVEGVGVVETEPDRATFTVSVEAEDREDADAVVRELAERAAELREALLDHGVDEDDITTSRYSLRERDHRYLGVHRYAVGVDDPDGVGETIDVAVAAGADSIGRVNFTLSEARREDHYEEAVDRAVADARREAELFAGSADRSVGEAVSMETSQTGHSPFSQRFDIAYTAEATDSGATQIEHGDVSVTARVTVEFELL